MMLMKSDYMQIMGWWKFMGQFWFCSKILKSTIFDSQRLALHQNRVEFRQLFNGAITTSVAVTNDGL